MTRADRIFACIGLGLSCWLILESLKFDYMTTYTPGPGFHPLWLGVCLGLLSLALLADTFRRKGSLKNAEKRLPEGKSLLRVGLILLFTAGFALSMTMLGFILTVILFVFLVLFVLERYSVFKSILYSCIMSGAIFLIFRYWLNVALPKGWLGL
jgi:putative tricarboxylic transport membrane protein